MHLEKEKIKQSGTRTSKQRANLTISYKLLNAETNQTALDEKKKKGYFSYQAANVK